MHAAYTTVTDPAHRRRLAVVALELRAVPTPSLTTRQKNQQLRSLLRGHGQLLQELSHGLAVARRRLWGGR